MLGCARASRMACASANIVSSTRASCAPACHLSRCHTSPTKVLLRSTRDTESGDHRRPPGPGRPDLLRPWPIALVPFCSFTYSLKMRLTAVSYTHLRAHETDSYLVCRLLLEKKKE